MKPFGAYFEATPEGYKGLRTGRDYLPNEIFYGLISEIALDPNGTLKQKSARIKAEIERLDLPFSLHCPP